MKTIQTPMGKLDKVVHLMKIADHLNITNQKNCHIYFDKLMNKYENNKIMFDYMLENINSCILDKAPIESTKGNFIALLEITTYSELLEAQVSEVLYEPSKLDYE